MRRSALLMLAMMGAARLGAASTALAAGTISASPGDTEVVVTLTAAPSGGVGSITTTLYRHTASFTPPGTGTSLGTLAQGSPITDTGRTNGVEYFYEAVHSDGVTSVNSNEVSATPEAEGGVEPFLDVDFEGYASTAALMADGTTFTLSEDNESATGQSNSVADIVLDASPPAGSGYTKAMRYDFDHGDPPGSPTNLSITIGRRIPFGQELQEVWLEYLMKWSDNFTTAGLPAPNDHKLIFVDTVADESGRWAFYVGSDGSNVLPHTLMAETCMRPTGFPGAEYLSDDGGMSAEDLWESDAWHTIRLHIKHSTTTSSADGEMHVWVDGALLHTLTGFNTCKDNGSGGPSANPEKVDGTSFCHNKDDGPYNTLMHIWWARIRAYDEDPGW